MALSQGLSVHNLSVMERNMPAVLALWKKRMKAIGGKPLIRQMSIPAQPPAFEDIGGRNVKQITIAPEELPARFVSMAGAAFKQLAGLK